ncbi:MAG: hypothetical protein R3F49_10995 [Planctomycetota bacterium]
MQRQPLVSLAATVLAVALTGCLGLRTQAAAPSTSSAAHGVVQRRDGTSEVVGHGGKTAREAFDDAMRRASRYADSEGMKLLPLRFDPSSGIDPFGQPEYTCGLTFRLEPKPAPPAALVVDPAFSAFEHRMRLLVDSGVLTIEEYDRLIASHPNRSVEASAER